MPYDYVPGGSPAERSSARSLDALKRKLAELQAEQLDMAVNRDARQEEVRGGFGMNGYGSPAWDLYADDLNRQGEIGKIKDALGGGTGQLQFRAGRELPTVGGGGSDAIGPSMRALGRQAYGGAIDHTPEGTLTLEGRDTTLATAMSERALAEANAGRVRAEAAADQAKTAMSPELGFHDQEYRRNQAAEDARSKADTLRGIAYEDMPQRGREAAQRLEEQVAKDRAEFQEAKEEWMDPVSAQMRTYKERLTMGPAELRANGIIMGKLIDKAKTLEQTAMQTGSKETVAVIQQIQTTIRNLDPMQPDYADKMKQYEAQLDAAMRGIKTPTTTPPPGTGVTPGVSTLLDRLKQHGYNVQG